MRQDGKEKWNQFDWPRLSLLENLNIALGRSSSDPGVDSPVGKGAGRPTVGSADVWIARRHEVAGSTATRDLVTAATSGESLDAEGAVDPTAR